VKVYHTSSSAVPPQGAVPEFVAQRMVPAVTVPHRRSGLMVKGMAFAQLSFAGGATLELTSRELDVFDSPLLEQMVTIW
jgi:hypothetical protein